MGKIYKKMNRVEDALLHFITALDLDPKSATSIKNIIDKLQAGNINDDSDEDIDIN
jgi:hypothetical protein